MFRRLANSLPKDPVAPASLEQLGYFVNDHDQIRMLRNPEQKYQIVINRNERVNDVCRQAMNACERNIVHERLMQLGFQTVRLPVGASQTDNHVPILASSNIASCKRVVVLFGERNNDPGILSYRVIGDEGIRTGSVLKFAEAVLQNATTSPERETPGMIIANPAQLLWYRGGQKAVSRTQWLDLPREYAVFEPFRVDSIQNTIPYNRDFREHVYYIFENILTRMLHEEAKLEIVGLEYTGMAAMEYLAQNWSLWSGRITGICLGSPQHKVQDLVDDFSAPESFVNFISKRCRAYFISPLQLGTVVDGRNEFGCNCYASGEEIYQENVLVRCWRNMVDWFDLLNADPSYEEAEFSFDIEPEQELPN